MPVPACALMRNGMHMVRRMHATCHRRRYSVCLKLEVAWFTVYACQLM